MQVIEHFDEQFKLLMPKNGHSIGYLFGLLEEYKHECRVQDYSASQTTLEQIFQNFAAASKQTPQ